MTDFNRYLSYYPESGTVLWRDSIEVFTSVRGFPAGSPHKEGYRQVKIKGRMYLLHRVIWHMVTGEWPPNDLDHIDGDRSNNKWVNLRLATRQENLRNSSGKLHTSKYKGVSWDKVRSKWVAYCKCDGKVRNLGRFDEERDAAMAYDNFVKDKFGDFARLNIHPSLSPEAIMV